MSHMMRFQPNQRLSSYCFCLSPSPLLPLHLFSVAENQFQRRLESTRIGHFHEMCCFRAIMDLFPMLDLCFHRSWLWKIPLPLWIFRPQESRKKCLYFRVKVHFPGSHIPVAPASKERDPVLSFPPCSFLVRLDRKTEAFATIAFFPFVLDVEASCRFDQQSPLCLCRPCLAETAPAISSDVRIRCMQCNRQQQTSNELEISRNLLIWGTIPTTQSQQAYPRLTQESESKWSNCFTSLPPIILIWYSYSDRVNFSIICGSLRCSVSMSFSFETKKFHHCFSNSQAVAGFLVVCSSGRWSQLLVLVDSWKCIQSGEKQNEKLDFPQYFMTPDFPKQMFGRKCKAHRGKQSHEQYRVQAGAIPRSNSSTDLYSVRLVPAKNCEKMAFDSPYYRIAHFKKQDQAIPFDLGFWFLRVQNDPKCHFSRRKIKIAFTSLKASRFKMRERNIYCEPKGDENTFC